MPEYLYPGVYVEEIDTGNKPIEGVSTSTVGFLGVAERGPVTPVFITNFPDYVRAFGRYYKKVQQQFTSLMRSKASSRTGENVAMCNASSHQAELQLRMAVRS